MTPGEQEAFWRLQQRAHALQLALKKASILLKREELGVLAVAFVRELEALLEEGEE